MTDQSRTVADVAAKLTDAQRLFLCAVVDNRRLRPADRHEDRARQICRNLGLVAYRGKPMRWQVSSFGLAVRAHLEQSS